MDPGHKARKNLSDNADLGFQAVGPALHIMQLNVEGLSAAKRHIIESLAEIHHIDVICLQETHVNDDKSDRLTISGFDIISYTLHAKHGRATYVRSDVSDAARVSSSSAAMNRFRTEQGHCGACRRKWQLTDTDLCPCGNPKTQTMSHIVESCPLTKLNGGLSRLHSADEDAVSWLTNYGK